MFLVTQEAYWPMYSYTLHTSGSASTLHDEPPEDPAQAVRDVVAEVTGKPVDLPPKPPFGFLP